MCYVLAVFDQDASSSAYIHSLSCEAPAHASKLKRSAYTTFQAQ